MRIKKIKLPPFLTGFVLLFVMAHFGTHMVGAMLSPLMPMIRSDLHLNYTQVGIITSAFFLTGGIMQLPAGFLVDHLGARLIVLLGVAGSAAAGLLVGLSHSYVFLIAALVISAILGSGYHPAAVSAISVSVPANYRGRSLGIHLIGGTSAMWVFPLVATPIAFALDWHIAYLILPIPMIILGMLVYFLMRKRDVAARTRKAPVSPSTGSQVATVTWQKLAPLLLMTVGAAVITRSATSYISLYAVDHLDFTEVTAGLLVALIPAAGIVAAPLGGYIIDKVGSLPVLIIASFLLIPLIFALGAVTSLIITILVLLAIGLATGVSMPAIETYITGNTPAKRLGAILGVYFFSGAALSGIFTPVMGNLFDRFGFQSAFTISSVAIGVITVTTSIFIWIVYRRAKVNPRIQ